MAAYFCKNCSNLKSRRVTKENLSRIKKDKILSALNVRDPDSLGLDFPFNMTVYKRVLKYGGCPILYCSERMLKRDLYIDRGNVAWISCGTTPCPKYK